MFFNRKKPSGYTILEPDNGATTNGFATRRSGHRRSANQATMAGEMVAESDLTRESLVGVDETLLLQSRGETVQMEFPTATVNALRHMTTRLMVNHELPKRTAIVAALRGEGVTYAALATAALLAHDTAQRVCYVDLNWWWPLQLSWRTGSNERGVAGVLREETPLEHALVATNFSNLMLLPAGHLHPKQRAMMARCTALTTLIGRLADQFDYLLLDIPAILTTSDAIPLASLAEGCCPVVRQGVSTNSLVGQALKEIDHLPMLGVIMNRAQSYTPSWLLKWIPQE